jgi:hypothetical protein
VKNFKKHAIAILLVSTITSAYTKEIETLEDWGAKTKNWSSEPSEFTYMLGRCAAAFIAMSAYMSQSSNQTAVKNSYELLERGKQYTTMSFELGKKSAQLKNFYLQELNRLLIFMSIICWKIKQFTTMHLV